jgi:hypothetical protein
MKTLSTFRVSLVLAPLLAGSTACNSNQTTTTFATPQDAMHEVASIAETGDPARAERVVGPEGVHLLQCDGDPQAREDGALIKAAIEQQLAFADEDANTKLALIGADQWPFPIPLVADHGRWRFDADAGRDELENRRIGQNELLTLATLHECVSAQQEYAAQGRDGKPPCYACRMASAEGQHDGLYWSGPDSEATSPVGPQLAAATRDDDGHAKSATPYHGYYFRCLTCQGQHAPGGEQKYADDRGLMTRGFALLAWPAEHGESGVMTFQISHRGIVYQKNLGPDTESLAAAITSFDPDQTWEPTGD